MNEKFFTLPEEKRERIINAGLKCFAKGGYKHTVTDDIAAQAEISKGLLFHYFGNKKELYEYLFGYSIRFVKERMEAVSALKGDDFFNIIQTATLVKTNMMKEHPYVFDFIIKAYYDESAPSMECIEGLYTVTLKENTDLILEQVGKEKFKEGADLELLTNMIYWMADGFMLRQQRAGNLYDMNTISAQFGAAMQELRRAFYKEEYI